MTSMASTVAHNVIGSSVDRQLSDDDAFVDNVRDVILVAMAVSIIAIIAVNRSAFTKTSVALMSFMNANTNR